MLLRLGFFSDLHTETSWSGAPFQRAESKVTPIPLKSTFKGTKVEPSSSHRGHQGLLVERDAGREA